MSMALPSAEVLRESAPDEAAVTSAPVERTTLDNDRPPGEHGVHVAVDLVALPCGVVHVHVVRLLDADAGVAGRVVDDDVSVRTRRDDALLRIQAEHPGRRRRAQLDPAFLADPPVGERLVD